MKSIEVGNNGEIDNAVFNIGAFAVKPARNLLVKNDDTYTLEPRIMDVLCVLANQPREVVSRQMLIDQVWKVEYGADESLTRAISILRKTFREAGVQGDIIQTIPKRGYRLARDVSHGGHKGKTPKPNIIAQPKQAINAPLFAEPVNFDIPSAVSPPLRAANAPSKKIMIGVIGLLLAGLMAFSVLRPSAGVPLGETDSINQYGNSIAVLSFADMSVHGDQEYFSDGIAEEILNALVNVSGLQVVGRSSSFSYKGASVDLRKIGAELNVSYLIDGSVRKQGNLMRISIQMIKVANGVQMWSKSYDGMADNILDLQEKVSQDIVTELRISLGTSLGEPIELTP